MSTCDADKDRRYVLISPCRDEAPFARRCIESVLKQTIPPALWVIVDDGSKDGTFEILKEYATRFAWIHVVCLPDRGSRKVGPGVVDAFYAGLKTIAVDAFEYLCKFDLDLDVPPSYFEHLIHRMEASPRLGTCSGKPYFEHGGKLWSERCGDEMSVGMTKFYRVACFLEIGGFVPEVMWDGIDCHRCRMKNWIACSWDDPVIRFQHLRPMGSSQESLLKGRQRHGFGQYFLGTGWLYMTVSAFYRVFHPPYVLGAFFMWWGYARSAWKNSPRYPDAQFRRFLRRFQWDCILLGKTRATERLHSAIRKKQLPVAAAKPAEVGV
jgi:glycosyltransferase involved in cell wall biosynthesis